MLILFLLGRGGIARIYVPPTAALLILCIATMSSAHRRILQLVGAVALVFLVNTLIKDWEYKHPRRTESARPRAAGDPVLQVAAA